MNEDVIPSSLRQASLQHFTRWLRQLGISEITGWRWRKRGWITTVNIAGRQYVSSTAIAEFERRATAGEFAQVHKTPSLKEAA